VEQGAEEIRFNEVEVQLIVIRFVSSFAALSEKLSVQIGNPVVWRET
jgi:hypothetical protein